MPRRLILGSVCVVLSVLFFATILLGFRKIVLVRSEKKVIHGMDQANYCAADDDCALVMYRCPFGCGAYINKQETGKINRMVSEYFKRRPGRCAYHCAAPIPPVCQSGRCVAKPCKPNKEYSVNFPDNCRCPPESMYVVKASRSGQKVFECVLTGKNDRGSE